MGPGGDAVFTARLRAGLLQRLNDSRRGASGEASRTLRRVRRAVRDDQINVALRHLDRAWRCLPEHAATLAPLYGRLLLLEARDDAAALGLLRQGLQFTPDPDVAALIAFALMRLGRAAEARQQVEWALGHYSAAPGDWLSQAAGALMMDASTSAGAPDFALDGRIALKGLRLCGWARLGWSPAQPVRLRIDDGEGHHRCVWTRWVPEPARRWPFALDLRTAGFAGSRIHVAAQLPDGAWQSLPDSPLLLAEAVLAPGAPPRPLGPWRAGVPRTRRARSSRAQRTDVIIPVYGNRDAALACVADVLASLDAETQLVVVDDASADLELIEALEAHAAAGRLVLLKNPANLGFAASVNRALALHPAHDAVLLNSDTRVFADWLPRLRAAAYSGSSVGTATPWSNSGSIASYPQAQGAEFDRQAGAALHALAARAHDGVRLDIPVGVGFCLYVRRDCLTHVGDLDVAVFGQGYGEETDFCLRARRRGWSHRLAADVFVHHDGGLSFGARRAALLERSQRLLNMRHPGFDGFVADFLQQNPLRLARRSLDERRLAALDARFVLIVTLALPGGVERYVTERCRELRAQGLIPLVLKPAKAGDARQCELSTEALQVPNLRYEIATDLARLAALLRSLTLEAIEVQHFLHLDARVIDMVRALGTPYEVMIHDYSWICPRVTLIDGSGRYCGEPAIGACERCVRHHGSNLGETMRVAALRARSRRWLRGARRVLAPSCDTARRLRRHFPGLKVDVRPHTAPHAPAGLPSRRPAGPVVRIALLGAIGEHKGYRMLLGCARDARVRRLPLEFVVIGHTEDDAALLETGKVFVTGRYTEGEAAHLLRREQPDVAWLPSVWPETWCYALDEVLWSGLPVVAFDLGAIAERLREAGRGELQSLTLPFEQINEHLMRVARAPATIESTPADEKTMTHAPQPTEIRADGLSASLQLLPLPAGLYLFSVTAAGAAPLAANGLSLPALHVGVAPGMRSDQVAFMGGGTAQGGWLFAAADMLVAQVNTPGATLILTSVRGPAGEVLSIKVERLNARSDAAGAAGDMATRPAAEPAPAIAVAAEGCLPVHIGAHIRSRGDLSFTSTVWAGRVAPGLWIESFRVRPLETFAAEHLEYKGLTGTGHETPWVSDDAMCGTQGMAVPLVGFALRFKPSAAAAAFDAEYSGYFQSGATVGPLRNGAPCRSSVANDPLEGIQVRLVKRAAVAVAVAHAGGSASFAERQRSARSTRKSQRSP